MIKSTKKVLIIGLDGIDPDLIEDFIQRGFLPNIKNLIENGIYGRLKSTIPTISNVSWNSFITGKNPGKHNTFGFLGFKENSYEIKSITSLDRKTDTIWHILNKYNKKVGIINLPSLYPPERIDSFMICGMLTPKINANFTYPQSLQKELLRRVKNYIPDIGTRRATKNKKILLKEIYEVTKKRKEAIQYLMGRFNCDLFIAIFTSTDRIQHFFWRDMQEVTSDYKDAILDYFQYVDSIIEDLIKDLDKNTTLFILSDHGMCRLNKILYMNNWFLLQGLLNIEKYSLDELKHLFVHTIVKWIIVLSTKLGLNPDTLRELIPSSAIDHLTNLYCYSGNIDWTKTKAYFLPGQGDGIIINLKGKYPQGIVESEEYELIRDYIIEKLYEIKDPDTKQPIINKIYKREELYSGSFVENAPDLIIQMKDGYRISEAIMDEAEFLKKVDSQELVTAEHRLDGLLIAYGRELKRGKIINAEIIDIAPTLLHLLDIPIPKDMDGRVLKEIFNEHSELIQKEIKYEDKIIEDYDLQDIKNKEEQKLKDKEDKKIKEILKSLGYF